MAIAYDNSTGSQKAVSGSTYTFSHTIGAGSDMGLFVIVKGDEAISGVTYNGVAMTQLYSDTAPFNVTCYYLANPSSGANNVVLSGTLYYASCVAISYSGIAQTNVVDGTQLSTGHSNLTVTSTVTTTVDNDWGLLYCGETNGNQPTISSGATYRNGASFGTTHQLYVYDSDASYTPTGSYSMALTTSGTPYYVIRMLAIKPSAVVTNTSKFFQLF